MKHKYVWLLIILLLIFESCSNQEKSRESYDSLVTILKSQESRIDSLVQLTEGLESAKSLKEAKILMGKWFWSEAEVKLIDVIIKYPNPNSNEAEEAKGLIEIVAAELKKMNVKPISIEGVRKEDRERFRKIERRLLHKKYVTPFSQELITEYGFPETQLGTDGKIWIAYFPNGWFTIIVDKNSDEIIQVLNKRRL